MNGFKLASSMLFESYPATKTNGKTVVLYLLHHCSLSPASGPSQIPFPLVTEDRRRGEVRTRSSCLIKPAVGVSTVITHAEGYRKSQNQTRVDHHHHHHHHHQCNHRLNKCVPNSSCSHRCRQVGLSAYGCPPILHVGYPPLARPL